jgi:cytochrome c-type biogenesis protein CcmF
VTALGHLALALALVFALAGVLFLALGVRWERKDLLRNGYYAVYAFFLGTVAASAILLTAFLRKDFSFAYVVENSDASLSVFYRISGFWAGQQGSFLLWLLLLAVVTVVIALRDLNRLERLTGAAVMVLCAVSAVFAALTVFDESSNPFIEAAAGATPIGLNPLLLHPGMVLHPPALFVGYVGLTVPFAFAIAALLIGRADRLWVTLSQKWAVFGWFFLSLGIGLGAWWAYVVLSFGGFWAWDPVENTSLVPWLTATAMLHAMTLYRTRGIFKRWALGSAALTFFFVILATWTTRTGLISSVHAFGRDDVLVGILTTLLVGSGLLSIGLLAWRWRLFASGSPIESVLSREFLYYLTALLLTLFATAIAFSTVLVPLLFDRSVGPDTYDVFARPLGVVFLALIALCPLLAWRKTEGAHLRRVLTLPAVAAALSVPLWLLLGFQSSVWGLIGLVVCGFAFGSVLQFVVNAARRAAGPGKAWTAGLRRALFGSRTRSAGYLAHLGMVLVVAGLLGSTVYVTESTALISTTAGSDDAVLTTDDGRYSLVLTGMRTEPGEQQSQRTYAAFDVFLDGDGTAIGSVEPRTDIYPVAGAAVRAVILGRPFEDVFVVADEPFNEASETIALRAVVFPLIRWVWIGSILLCLGAVVSLWPRMQPQEALARDAAVEPAADGRAGEATA